MIQFQIKDHADQKFSTVLNGKRVSIRIRYNPTSDRWSFDLAIDAKPVLHGRRIVSGVDLLSAFNFDVGLIFAFSELGKEPNREQLPNGLVRLYHASTEEINGFLAS